MPTPGTRHGLDRLAAVARLGTKLVPEAETIADAVRTVAQGGTYLPARLAHKLAGIIMFRTELTERELAVLRLMCEGKANKEIGAALFISEGTVKTHVKNLFAKLDVNSRSEAVAAAIRRGLVRG